VVATKHNNLVIRLSQPCDNLGISLWVAMLLQLSYKTLCCYSCTMLTGMHHADRHTCQFQMAGCACTSKDHTLTSQPCFELPSALIA